MDIIIEPKTNKKLPLRSVAEQEKIRGNGLHCNLLTKFTHLEISLSSLYTLNYTIHYRIRCRLPKVGTRTLLLYSNCLLVAHSARCNYTIIESYCPFSSAVAFIWILLPLRPLSYLANHFTSALKSKDESW